MKKYVQIVLPALVAALLACPSAQAQSLKDLLNRDNVEKLVGAVTGVNLAEMTGTWVYTGAAVEFESDKLPTHWPASWTNSCRSWASVKAH